MSDNKFCSSCDKKVGVVVKRGPYVILGVLAVVIFFGLILIQAVLLKDTPTFTPGGVRMVRSGYMSDWWLLLPIVLIGLSIRSFFKKRLKCPICNSSL